MGQRASIQQPSGEIARRPRANSGTAGESTHQSSHHHHRSSNANNSMRYRFQQRDSTSLSSSNSSSSVDEDNRSDEGAAGAELAAAIMSHLGLSSAGVREAATISPSSAPSGSTHRNNHGGGRRSESGVNLNNANTNTPSSLFHHNRGGTAHNHHRIGGSQRLRGPRSSGFGSGSSTAANELLARGRLNALLQSLEASSSSSFSSHASNALRSMGTQQQQIVINRLRHSLPLLQLFGRDVKCPVCHKMIPSDDVEMHLVMCLTRPVLSYNDDVLTADKGECAICLDEMSAGDQIARLPCLCIYHKDCIDEWFKRRNTCPEHPPVEEDD